MFLKQLLALPGSAKYFTCAYCPVKIQQMIEIAFFIECRRKIIQHFSIFFVFEGAICKEELLFFPRDLLQETKTTSWYAVWCRPSLVPLGLLILLLGFGVFLVIGLLDVLGVMLAGVALGLVVEAVLLVSDGYLCTEFRIRGDVM